METINLNFPIIQKMQIYYGLAMVYRQMRSYNMNVEKSHIQSAVF